MELIEKLKVANAEVFILDYYVGPDELGESQTGIQTFTSFNGFSDPADYKADLYNTYVDLYDNIIGSDLSKFEILKNLHDALNELKIVEFFLQRKTNDFGQHYIIHKYFRGVTDSNNPEYLENKTYDIKEYLNIAYEIYQMAEERINSLIKTFQSVSDENIAVIEKPTKVIPARKKIYFRTGVQNLATLFWMLNRSGIMITTGKNLFTYIRDNFETVGSDEIGLNSLSKKYYEPDAHTIDYWCLELLRMRDALLYYQKNKK